MIGREFEQARLLEVYIMRYAKIVLLLLGALAFANAGLADGGFIDSLTSLTVRRIPTSVRN